MQQEVNDFIASIRDCPPRQAGDKVLIPGDPERAKRAEVKASGVNLGDAIIDQLKTISGKLSIALPPSLA
jgi:LDH2 family malate/lactate/ureidoglycolate dehydrogenase